MHSQVPKIFGAKKEQGDVVCIAERIDVVDEEVCESRYWRGKSHGTRISLVRETYSELLESCLL